MPCYNLLWGLHVPYLFSLYLGVNRGPSNQAGMAAVALAQISPLIRVIAR
jgi:hypothetical protein